MIPVGRGRALSGLAFAAGLSLMAGVAIRAQSGTPASTGQPTPTFTRHVLPILQRSCQQCHHPGTSAPMSLMTYDEVRPWARAIKQRVTRREMPPWHIDRSIGEYLNDPSLSDDEVALIRTWVDAGAPQYKYQVPHLFPAGTILHVVSWHDNTANNKHNPDPTAWIGWGNRTMDEMGHGWTDVAFLTDEQYREEVAKRHVQRHTTTSQQR